jgi:asparagine synthase (glutamine-hydrolysing)
MVRRFWARRPQARWRSTLLRRLYPDIPGLAQTPLEVLAGFFGADLSDVDSPWYSHAVRWRNNRRTLRFLTHASGNLSTTRLAGPQFEHLAESLPSDFKGWSPLARAQYIEISIFLSHYLLSSQGDRMGMAHSIEGRFPFLDHRLVEFSNALHPRFKLRCLREKVLLRAAVKPWLPESIHRRPKRPYRAPIHRCFFNESPPEFVAESLCESALKDCGLFHAEAVRRLVEKIKSGAPIGETDQMALAGILSTQLLHRLFVRSFASRPPLSRTDPVRVRRLNCVVKEACHDPLP